MYPKLSGFVIIMMQRLIGKQIWKYPKVWEGFIKCCQRIKPICHQALFQLPQAQLKEVFTAAPDLKEHCKSFLSGNPENVIFYVFLFLIRNIFKKF
jgi:symplekin